MSETLAPEPTFGNEVLSQVARDMTQIYKQQFGRGPTSVRARWTDEDTLVCVLEDTLTAAESKLVELGDHQAVREMRVALQHATTAEFCGSVERATGRKVRAFHSSTDTHAGGQSVELFVLHPAGYRGPGRADL